MEEQDDGYGFAASFSEKAVRLGFIRKVYSILCIQVQICEKYVLESS
jgi:hypothetical protein